MTNETELGHMYLNAGNIGVAKKQAEIALGNNPNEESALSLMHDCLFYGKEYKTSEEFAEHWVSLNPLSEKAHAALVISYLLTRDKKKCCKSIEHYKSSFSCDSLTIQVYESMYEMSWGSANKAAKKMDELRGKYEGLNDFLIIQGHVEYERSCMENAMNLAKEALQYNPDEENAWRLLAASSFREMRFSKARCAAKEALRLDPSIKSMRQIVLMSKLVYFPLFFAAHFVNFLFFRLKSKVRVEGVYNQIMSVIFYYVIFSYVVAPVFNKLSVLIKPFGFSYTYAVCSVLILGWILTVELTFFVAESNKSPKVKSIKLSKY